MLGNNGCYFFLFSKLIASFYRWLNPITEDIKIYHRLTASLLAGVPVVHIRRWGVMGIAWHRQFSLIRQDFLVDFIKRCMKVFSEMFINFITFCVVL